MSAQPDVGVGDSYVSAEAIVDLEAESLHLARTLNQPRVHTQGAAGILSDLAPSTVWVYDDVDMDALLGEIADRVPQPEVMVSVHAERVAAALRRHGWMSTDSVDRLSCELSPWTHRGASSNRALIRSVALADLPKLRALHVVSFDDEDSVDYLPDSLLDIADLRMFVATAPADAQTLLGAVGVRLRHRGALVFGLATLPEARRSGIATALVSHSLAWAAEHGAPFALADVDLPVPSFWAALGFTTTSRWLRFSQADPSR